MNKTLLTIATIGLLTLFSSAYYSAPADSRIGYKAPSLVLGNDNNDLSPLRQHRDENVLLTFWSSDDAESRMEDMRYDRLARSSHHGYTHVSVNLDRSTSVFNAVVEVNDLDRSTHFTTSLEAQETIIKNWRLEGGYHSFLLNKDGEIVAIDPDEQVLARIK